VDTTDSSPTGHSEATTRDPRGNDHDQERDCFACYDGWVYMGFVEDDGEDEQIERVPCRRCSETR
jgi:hypothetical protein